MTNIVQVGGQEKVISIADMPEGGLGIITEPKMPSYDGLLVISGHNYIVGIERGLEWSKMARLNVRLLPAGTKITITVGE